jgi:hypothetical protein
MLLQAARRSWSTFLVAVVLWMFAGCSAGGDSALSSADNPVGDSAGTGSFPQPDDAVFALVADGSGGVYVGGQFTRLGQLTRQRLAHILPNGTVDSAWEPVADGPVTALLLQNQTLYIGGNFFTTNGVERWRLAAIDRLSGELTAWNPKLGTANGVNALVSSAL